MTSQPLILLVRQDSWKLQLVRDGQLTDDVLSPRCNLLPTGTAFQVLRAHEVPAVPVQDPPDGPVQSCARHLSPTVVTHKLACPHPVGQPQEERALEESVGRGGGGVYRGRAPGGYHQRRRLVVRTDWPLAFLVKRARPTQSCCSSGSDCLQL